MTTDTPRTDAERNKAFCNLRTDYEAYVYMANHAETLERELTEKTNEVARLRELLNRAIEIADNYEIAGLPRDGFMLHWKINKHEFSMLKEKIRLSFAPEEPCYPNCANTTHKFSHCDCKEPATDWRELGPDEVIQEGDCWEVYGELKPVTDRIGWKINGSENYPISTRRPLPKQDEMPMDQIEQSLKWIEGDGKYPLDHDEMFGEVVNCIRYLRDEIQKLKEAQ
jgi:hypothetical protein